MCSRRASRELAELVPSWVRRIATDDQSVADIAAEFTALTGWLAADPAT